MASVTGLTADRMLEIEGASIVSGEIDEAGHLILTKHDGTQIDAGNAVVAVPEGNVVNILDPGPTGYTETIEPHIYPEGVSLVHVLDTLNQGWPSLGFNAGTVLSVRTPSTGNGRVTQYFQSTSGTNTEPGLWIRAGISNFGWTSWRKVATEKYTEDRVKIRPNTILPTDSIETYPSGVSAHTAAGTGGASWGDTPSSPFGTILTVNGGTFRSFQMMQVEDGYLHFRRYREDNGGWRPWTKVLTEHRLSPSNYNQGTAFTQYPWGMSFLYLNSTDSTAGGWSFAANFAMVITYRYSDDYVYQEYRNHQSGSGGRPEVWTRSANAGSGWTPWRKHNMGVVAVKDQALSNTVAANSASTHTINLPTGKTMFDTNYTIQFYITEHNTAQFGSAIFTPLAARPVSATQFLVRVHSNWSTALSGYISYTLTPVQ